MNGPDDCPKTRDIERAIDRADWLRDERRDREMEERKGQARAGVERAVSEQLELFPTAPAPVDLLPSWRDRLTAWPAKVAHYRHARGTNGWSMSVGGYVAARILFREGEMDRRELKRWWLFNRRVRRWDQLGFTL